MSYGNDYYAAQRRVIEQIRFAVNTGLCPVCRERKRATWRDDGQMRMTCGDAVCFRRWLPVRGEQREGEVAT